METTVQSLEQQRRMAAYILEVLRNYPIIVMSWGVDNKSYRIAEDAEHRSGLEFTVQGFKHKGKVQILYDEGADAFLFNLIDTDGKTVKTREDVYFNELVPAIDEAVEKVENYSARICQEYGIS